MAVPASRVLVVLLALGAAGCERGCLARKADVVGGRAASSAFAVTGTDCPPGIARCRDGNVEVSLAGHVPAACAGEACRCPYRFELRCPRDCAIPGAEIAMEPAAARAQLCVALDRSFAAPAIAPPADVACEGAYRCFAGHVLRCNHAVVARCVFGCATSDALDEAPSDAAAVDVLCARSPSTDR